MTESILWPDRLPPIQKRTVEDWSAEEVARLRARADELQPRGSCWGNAVTEMLPSFPTRARLDRLIGQSEDVLPFAQSARKWSHVDRATLEGAVRDAAERKAPLDEKWPRSVIARWRTRRSVGRELATRIWVMGSDFGTVRDPHTRMAMYPVSA